MINGSRLNTAFLLSIRLTVPRGFGMQLYRFAMEHAGTRVVGCDGVVAMVDKYQKDGGMFLHYNNARYEGIGGGTMPDGLVPIRDVNFDLLASYDAAHFLARRKRFLLCWIEQKGTLRSCTGGPRRQNRRVWCSEGLPNGPQDRPALCP